MKAYFKLMVSQKNKQREFKAPSGTLKTDYKIKLCDFVINSKYNYKDLIENNEVFNKIIEDLFNFIEKKSH